MRTVLANFLVGERTAHDFGEDGFLVERLERFVERIDEVGEELDGVVLLAHVHRFVVQTNAINNLLLWTAMNAHTNTREMRSVN